MKPFQDRFKTGDTGSKVGGIFGTFNAGSMIGGPCNSYVMDKWGRRAAQAAGAIIIVVGTILTTTSHTLAQLIVGRLVLGFGSAFAQSAPAYAMEVARPQWRGRCAAICKWRLASLGTHLLLSSLLTLPS